MRKKLPRYGVQPDIPLFKGLFFRFRDEIARFYLSVGGIFGGILQNRKSRLPRTALLFAEKPLQWG